jgi:hypothetical protein
MKNTRQSRASKSSLADVRLLLALMLFFACLLALLCL